MGRQEIQAIEQCLREADRLRRQNNDMAIELGAYNRVFRLVETVEHSQRVAQGYSEDPFYALRKIKENEEQKLNNQVASAPEGK